MVTVMEENIQISQDMDTVIIMDNQVRKFRSICIKGESLKGALVCLTLIISVSVQKT